MTPGKTKKNSAKTSLQRLEDGILWAGVDEAGRGCLAGPVCAAAVILPDRLPEELINGLNDSKKLSEKVRYKLRPLIEQYATSWAIGWASAREVDELNILQATFLSMHRAIDNLSIRPQMLAIDGNRFKPCSQEIIHKCFVGGDARYYEIAAASILAKTYRDDYMMQIDLEYPDYQWAQNKGYPTLSHKKTIFSLGKTKYHRKSFNCAIQLNIFE
ncbi:MAG: ribonuclease HII [Bacteroidales bacterium]|nr:ribonuclease HII [Bacteroidales bacterium]